MATHVKPSNIGLGELDTPKADTPNTQLASVEKWLKWLFYAILVIVVILLIMLL